MRVGGGVCGKGGGVAVNCSQWGLRQTQITGGTAEGGRGRNHTVITQKEQLALIRAGRNAWLTHNTQTWGKCGAAAR